MQRQITTKAEARTLMDEIVDCAERGVGALEQAFALARKFETDGLFRQLGYKSMAACWSTEMGQTRRRWYQLRDQFAASEMLTEAAGEPVKATARAAEVVRRDPESVKRFHTSVESGETPKAAMREITRSAFRDGSSSDVDYDTGEAVYECRHCGRKGSVGQLSKCLTLLRSEVEAF